MMGCKAQGRTLAAGAAVIYVDVMYLNVGKNVTQVFNE
jgi:hypothetical protein